jgi:hypothetical protein
MKRPIILLFSSIWLLTSCSAGNESQSDTSMLAEARAPSSIEPVAWTPNDNPNVLDLDSSFNYKFSELPEEGEAEQIPWAGNYWPTYRDSVNYRWDGPDAESPSEKFEEAFGLAGIADSISENYGIDSRRNSTSTTCTENDVCDSDKGEVCSKRTGQEEGVCVETWFGICHAWAPVAIMEPEPKKAVTYNGVTFKVNDLKALVTLSYDKGLKSKLMSGRCNDTNTGEEGGIEFDEQGRPTDDFANCRDTNPGSFHIVLANMLGIQKKALVEDRTFDYEVWNQPIRGYRVTQNTEVTKVEAIALVNQEGDAYTYNQEAVTFRHMKMAVQWIRESHQETDGNFADTMDTYTVTDNYEYLLEIDRDGLIIGGEWLGDSKTDHPDFLWVGVEKSNTEVAVPDVELSKHDDVAIANGEWHDFGSVSVTAGDSLSVKMTGAGDGDLYVRWGDAPTQSNYTCRPYKAGSNETCTLEVPNGTSTAHIKAKGTGDGTTVNLVASKSTPGSGIKWTDVKMLLELSIADDTTPDTGGFNWGNACEGGSGSFVQPVAQQATLDVGEIPPSKNGVEISLDSVEDVDIQLLDKETGHEIIAWPNGDLNGSSEECTTYEGVQYCYSGYNGDCGSNTNGTNGCSYGKEWIRVTGSTNRQLVMKAFGYAAGEANVDYSWQALPDCVDEGSGTFSQHILRNAIVDVGVIPQGKQNIKIELTSEKDVDIQLYQGDDALIKWPDGRINGPGVQTLTHNGMTITWSGYNGDGSNLGNEYIHIQGEITADLTMKAFGYAEGDAQVDYAWGVPDSEF